MPVQLLYWLDIYSKMEDGLINRTYSGLPELTQYYNITAGDSILYCSCCSDRKKG